MKCRSRNSLSTRWIQTPSSTYCGWYANSSKSALCCISSTAKSSKNRNSRLMIRNLSVSSATTIYQLIGPIYVWEITAFVRCRKYIQKRNNSTTKFRITIVCSASSSSLTTLIIKARRIRLSSKPKGNYIRKGSIISSLRKSINFGKSSLTNTGQSPQKQSIYSARPRVSFSSFKK
jgi:hypothetical protein